MNAVVAVGGIEIGGGLGSMKGKVWRIGLMGESSTAANVTRLLAALERLLPRHGFACRTDVGVTAAQRVYTSRLLGRDKSLVLHGGGNTSVKLEESDLFGEQFGTWLRKGRVTHPTPHVRPLARVPVPAKSASSKCTS